MNAFEDADIAKNLDANFPNSFPVSLPVLDTNVLCMYDDFKVGKYKEELAALFEQ